jgi:hypothetical protein
VALFIRYHCSIWRTSPNPANRIAYVP